MKFIATALLLITASACKVDQDVIDAIQEVQTKRTGMEALSLETRNALKKRCSAYVEGLALFTKGGGDCDDSRRDVYPGEKKVDPVDADSDGDGLDDGTDDIELVMGNPLYEDGGDISSNPLYQGMAARYADNMFGDFLPQAAEAQDYNAARSNKPTSRRGDIIGGGARVIGEFSEDLARIYTGEDSGEYFLDAISKEMGSLELDPKYARSLYGQFIDSLQQVYKKEQQLLKSADRKQSEAIYEKAAKRAGLSVDALKELVRTTSAEAQKKMAIGESVEITGFGIFSISKRSARTGRNPQTGKEIKIASAPSVVTIRKRPGRTKYSNITLKK